MMYAKQGEVPQRKHVATYQKKNLICEELFSTLGFSGIYSTLYHRNPPTQLISVKKIDQKNLLEWEDSPYDYHHFDTMHFMGSKSEHFKPDILFFNDEVEVGVLVTDPGQKNIFKNVDQHELFFVHQGQGQLFSPFGVLNFKFGDYLVLPKGVPYQFEFYPKHEIHLFYVGSRDPFEIPKEFRNQYGQLLEHSPYCERDFQLPALQAPLKGKTSIVQLKDGNYYEMILKNHPFDVIGWDGFLYPFVFNIKDYMPKVGKIHLPPPIHRVFENRNFVVCNFVPRLLDFHDKAITAPYYHSNIDSDEVLYYLDGEFLSRKGIGEGSITLHPMGLVHGPQPGKQEASINKKETNEYAVMIDTFRSLKLTNLSKGLRLDDYGRSWLS